MSKRQIAAQILSKTGGLTLLNAIQGSERLTVLAYHRINDWTAPDFLDFEPNVSANVQMFDEQMAYVAEHFNVISLQQLDDFLTGGVALPERPLLITFDDGYMDNYENAFPILKKYNFPAVIFIVTGRMDNPSPLWWDNCAYCFKKTTRTAANLPLLGQRNFVSAEDRMMIRDELLGALKEIPEADKQASMLLLQDVLDVSYADRKPVFFTWNEVNELVAGGVACQPHTVTHPILTRVSIEDAHEEIAMAKKHIEENTNQEAIAFAYPNGNPGDYSADTIRSLKESGYRMAFTLSKGPVSLKEVAEYPFQVRRVYLGNDDTIDLYATKVMGVPALLSNDAYL